MPIMDELACKIVNNELHSSVARRGHGLIHRRDECDLHGLATHEPDRKAHWTQKRSKP
jgi:hypothetical protein